MLAQYEAELSSLVDSLQVDHSQEVDYHLECADGTSLDGQIARRVQGFRGNLAQAVALTSSLEGLVADEAEAKIRLILERKAYGEKSKNCVLSEDCAPLACWHWEVASLALFSKASQAVIKQARLHRSRNGRKVKAIKKLIEVLTKNPEDKAKISREEEKVDKIKREEQVDKMKREEAAKKREEQAAKKKVKPPPLPPPSEKKKAKTVSSAQQNLMKMFTRPQPKQQQKETEKTLSTTKLHDSTSSSVDEEGVKESMIGSSLDLDNLPPCTDILKELKPRRRRSTVSSRGPRYFSFYERAGLPPVVIDDDLRSSVVTGVTPFSKDPNIDYDADSVVDEEELLAGDEGEPADAESLNDDDDEDDEEDNLDYDDGFLLGDDEVDGTKVEQQSSSQQHNGVFIASPTQNTDFLRTYAAVLVTPLNPTDSWRPPLKPKRQRKPKQDGDTQATKKRKSPQHHEPPSVVLPPAADRENSTPAPVPAPEPKSADHQRKLTTFFAAAATTPAKEMRDCDERKE